MYFVEFNQLGDSQRHVFIEYFYMIQSVHMTVSRCVCMCDNHLVFQLLYKFNRNALQSSEIIWKLSTLIGHFYIEDSNAELYVLFRPIEYERLG